MMITKLMMMIMIITRSGWSGEYCDQEQEDDCEDGIDNDGGQIIINNVITTITVGREVKFVK